MSAFYYTNTFQSPLISFLNSLKISYHNTLSGIENSIERHFLQAKKIDELKQKLQKCNNDHLLLQEFATELATLYKENNSTIVNRPKTELVRTISYEKFGNLNRVWLDVPEYNNSKIYGLVYQDFVAGIVVPKEGKAMGLLNSDIKSTYAVYVGKEKAPGIAHGNNGKYLLVDFIPAWFHIKEGDEVITSGLDNIFFQGLKVGRVISISKSQGYQNVLIDQYYKATQPNYFHIIRSVR